MRGSAVSVMRPKFPSPWFRFGVEKLAWLAALKHSARNSVLILSVNGDHLPNPEIGLDRDRGSLPGPRAELFREYPSLEEEDLRQALTFAAANLDERIEILELVS